MAKPELGLKRTCTGCGARFYDLARDPIVCPKCETTFDPTAQSRSSRTRSTAAKGAKAPPPVAAADKTEEKKAAADDSPDEVVAIESVEDIDEDSEDQAVIEDASELGEDKDDMFEVMNKVVVPDGDTP